MVLNKPVCSLSIQSHFMLLCLQHYLLSQVTSFSFTCIARMTLKQCDVLLCESTMHSSQRSHYLKNDAKLISYLTLLKKKSKTNETTTTTTTKPTVNDFPNCPSCVLHLAHLEALSFLSSEDVSSGYPA